MHSAADFNPPLNESVAKEMRRFPDACTEALMGCHLRLGITVLSPVNLIRCGVEQLGSSLGS